MASTDIVTTQISLPPSRDGSIITGSGRLLSKLTRSPTNGRRHKNNTSVYSTSADSVADQLSHLPSAAHAGSQRTHLRPELPRNVSAPVVPTIVNLPRENTSTRTYSDSTNRPIIQSNVRMLEPSIIAALKPPGSSSGKTNMLDPNTGGLQPPSGQQVVPNFHYQQIHETSHKRIATLNYMRKSHEGKKFWFNTVQFSKTDISRLPTYTPNRLARRAQSFLLLGFSVPAVLDVYQQPHPNSTPSANSVLASEFLRSLNTLLTEFESYQQLHPSDGSHVSSLTRARIPQMFKRATITTRPRKSSGAPEVGQASQISPPAMPDQPHNNSQFSLDSTYSSNTFATSASTLVNASPVASMPSHFSTSSSFPAPGPADAANSTCLPNEGPYTHLVTPPLPFAPDFFAVFATLCDVLIDVYQRLLQIISTPTVCTTQVADAFTKADARIRKVMVGGIVRDFEGAARESSKRELMGVQKVVLGGLMGV